MKTKLTYNNTINPEIQPEDHRIDEPRKVLGYIECMLNQKI